MQPHQIPPNPNQTNQQPTEQYAQPSSSVVQIQPSKIQKINDFLLDSIKAHKKVLSIVAGIIAFIILAYIVIPVVSIPFSDTFYVNRNTSFRITPGQTGYTKNGSVKVVINNFINDVCPVPGTCISNEDHQAVVYDINVDGESIKVNSDSPTWVDWKIETIDTDYKTYADIKLIKL